MSFSNLESYIMHVYVCISTDIENSTKVDIVGLIMFVNFFFHVDKLI